MDDFHWIHFSDLHFSSKESFITMRARDKLIRFLCGEKLPCDYIFITGDIANKNSYRGADDVIHKLIAAASVPVERVFWAVGNHDIERSTIRETFVHGFRDVKNAPELFEKLMQDAKARKLLTYNGMRKYLTQYTKILNREITVPQANTTHLLYRLPELNLIVLNTCLASCDDQDEGRLLIMESELVNVFTGIENGKPTIVIGHHGLRYFEKTQQREMGRLFNDYNVGCYLCGHAHELGCQRIEYSSREINQYTCGIGVTQANLPKAVFIHGSYYHSYGTMHVTPYSYHENGNWAVDYEIHERLGKSNVFQIFNSNNQQPRSRLIESTEDSLSEYFIYSQNHFHRLRSGRFAYFEIDQRLYAGVKPLPIMISEPDEQPETLYDILGNHNGNFIFIGEGGTGKTTSLLNIWEHWLEAGIELPLYVPLNEYNGKVSEYFIMGYLKKWYNINLNTVNGAVILLLDGFNEIFGDLTAVIREIKDLTSRYDTRVVLTSRHKFITLYGLEGFTGYNIQPLSSKVIRTFWEDSQRNNPDLRDIELPVDWETLLSTPMMLSLFANTCAVRKKSRVMIYSRLNHLKPKVS